MAIAHAACYQTRSDSRLSPSWSQHWNASSVTPVGWAISTEHFDPDAMQRRSTRRRRIPLADILVEGSTFSRGHLKERLYEEGLKARRCERCGTDETWLGRPMSLILDHVNGVATDNRLENLGSSAPTVPRRWRRIAGGICHGERTCPRCDRQFAPRELHHRYCSISCAASDIQEGRSRRAHSRPDTRRVERPSFPQLQLELDELGFRGVGRKYGVSDNAVRKWLKTYENSERVTGFDATARA